MADIYSNLESSTKENAFRVVAGVLGGKENTAVRNREGRLTDETSNTKGQLSGFASQLETVIMKRWPGQSLWTTFLKHSGWSHRRGHVTS